MASGTARRLDAIEALLPKPVVRPDFSAQRAAAERDRLAYDSGSAEERIALRRRQVADLQTPVATGAFSLNAPAYSAMRIELLEADIAELEGATADVVTEMRERAHCRLSGRPYELPAPPKPPVFGDDVEPGVQTSDGTLVVGKRKRPVEPHDPLADYRGNDSRLHLEPRFV